MAVALGDRFEMAANEKIKKRRKALFYLRINVERCSFSSFETDTKIVSNTH